MKYVAYVMGIALCAPLLSSGVAIAQAQGSKVDLTNGTYYAIGDSISNDRYNDEQFAQVVVKAFPGLTLENLALGGSSAAYALNVEVPKIPSGNPACKLVTLETGGGDLIRQAVPISTVQSQFAQVYQAVRQRCPHATIVIATYINNAQQERVRADLDEYNQWLRGFPSQNKLLLVDLAADRRFNDGPFPSTLMRNWAHPSTSGNQIVGQDFVDVLNAARAATPSP